MKLAEALLLRSDRSRAFEELKARAQAVARYQHGEEPPEDASQLVAEAEEAISDLEWLAGRITRTNSSVALADGRSLADALAERDALRLRISLLTAVADAATGREPRPGGVRSYRQVRSELRYIAAVPVASLREEVNKLARAHRELDAVIQRANWTADVVEDRQ
jgi:hypothetical protein